MVKRLLLAFFLMLSGMSYSSHIVGGEFELTYLEPNKYLLRLILYFDEISGFPTLLDQEVVAHIFRQRDDSLMLTQLLPKMGQEEVSYLQEWCDDQEVQTLRLIYGDTLTLSDEQFSDLQGYYIAWENCCRNYGVTNVQTGSFPVPGTDPFNQPTTSGQTFYLEFPSISRNGEPFINSSPSNFPPLNAYACLERPYWVNFAGSDEDGDSLTYLLVPPKDNKPNRVPNVTRPAPYPEVPWVEGYGPSNYMSGDPSLAITIDGFLSVTPREPGLFVFGVKVDEYRDGERIGTLQREFQIYVDEDCIPTFSPVIQGRKKLDPDYNAASQLAVTFGGAVTDENRCVNIRVQDDDALNEDEVVFIQAVPLNFDDDISGILPEETFSVLNGAGGYEFDICLPECPFIDPLISDVVEIGIIVTDDACPIPNADTLHLSIVVAPPANQSPYLITDGSQVAQYSRNVTEQAAGSLSFPIEGVDPDNDSVRMEIIPVNDFDPALAGMGFSALAGGAGTINTTFSWQFDCQNESLDFSEGTPAYNPTRKLYDFLVLVEDKDECDFSRADTLDLRLSIEFPDELPPEVFIQGENPDQEYYLFNYEVNQTVELDIKALDGTGDNDRINLALQGVNYDPQKLGAEFPGVQSGPGTEPGSISTFTWPLICSLMEMTESDTVRSLFIVEEINQCNLALSDTLTVDIVIREGENNMPELIAQSIPDEVPVLDNVIETDVSNNINFNVVGTDTDYDSLYLNLVEVIGPQDLNYSFSPAAGFRFTSSLFSLENGCDLLYGDSLVTSYHLTFLLEDGSCLSTAADTLTVNIEISDIDDGSEVFLPANVFTPNGDGVNDYFAMTQTDEMGDEFSILPGDNCRGRFEQVIILNRYGQEVFSSKDRNFRWHGENYSTGTYYYLIRYSQRGYRGVVSLLN